MTAKIRYTKKHKVTITKNAKGGFVSITPKPR